MKFIKLFENYNSDSIEDLFLHLIDDNLCIKEKDTGNYFSLFKFINGNDYLDMINKLNEKKIIFFTIGSNGISKYMYKIYIPDSEIIDFFLEKTNNIKEVPSNDYPYIIDWVKDGRFLCEYNREAKTFKVEYLGFWEIFETKYGMSRIDTELFMEFMLSRYFNIYNLGRIRPI
jgi:hypothetical protein